MARPHFPSGSHYVTPPITGHVRQPCDVQSRELVGVIRTVWLVWKNTALDSALQGWANVNGRAYNRITPRSFARLFRGLRRPNEQRIRWGVTGGTLDCLNGAFFYDVRDDGTGKREVRRRAWYVQCTQRRAVGPVPSICPDGRPNAAHTYLRVPTVRRASTYKFGHLVGYVGEVGRPDRRRRGEPGLVIALAYKPWNTFEGQEPFLPAVKAMGHGPPGRTKALYGT